MVTWRPRRGRAWVGAALLVALLFVVTVAALRARASNRSVEPPVTVSPVRPAAPPVPPLPAATPTAGAMTWHTPVTAALAGTPIQQEYDQAFAQGLGTQTGMHTAQSLAVPAPAITGGWPALLPATTPERWAGEFVSGLLDVDYGRMSLSGLGAWVDAQEAPELLPGVPAAAADKMLYISLFDPGLFGGQPTPVASATQWLALRQAGARQSAGDLLVQTDPAWAQMVAAGWQPTDARTTELDVSGVLTIRSATSSSVVTHHFGLQVIVGSARWHDGYGTVATAGWEETSQ
jgi:hypothetical protein